LKRATSRDGCHLSQIVKIQLIASILLHEMLGAGHKNGATDLAAASNARSLLWGIETNRVDTSMEAMRPRISGCNSSDLDEMRERASPRHVFLRQRVKFNPLGFVRTRQSAEFTLYQIAINP
jgi:hypothetical protein